MMIRMHRGSLADAMTTARGIDDTLAAVEAFLESHDTPPGHVAVKRYCYDPRTGWDTYIVLVDGIPWAWTDGPVRTTA
jgi:hypothetical protein